MLNRTIVTLNPPVWDDDQPTRDRCAADEHPPLTFNPLLDLTFCRCGAAHYPGGVGHIDHEGIARHAATTPAPWMRSTTNMEN